MKFKSEKKNKNGSRREFLKTLSGAAASVFVYGSCKGVSEPSGGNNQGNQESTVYSPRNGITNPYVTSDGRPILVSVTGTDFNQMLRTGLEAIGGLRKLITNNQDVLIKPNLFEKSQYPWISDLNSIIDIVGAVKNVTAGVVSVGDMSYESTRSVYDYLGFESAITDAGGNPLMFSGTYDVRRDTWSSSKPSYKVYADIYNSPVIINTCVLKPHFLAQMTCAIKCNVGTIQGSGTSSSRSYMHSQVDLQVELAEVAGLTNPDLNIVDARSIVTVSGPYYHYGGPVVDAHKVIICGDIVATDVYCARVLEENDSTFRSSWLQNMLTQAEELGMGTSDLSQVEILEIST